MGVGVGRGGREGCKGSKEWSVRGVTWSTVDRIGYEWMC